MSRRNLDKIGTPVADRIDLTVTLIGLAGAVIGFLIAPDVDARHPPSDLGAFFSTSAQVTAALVVALALFQSGPSPAAGHGARRFLSVWVFPVLGIGLLASVSGLSESLPLSAYRWLFAVVVGAGLAALFSTLLVGTGNLHAQRQQAIQEQAEKLGKPPYSSDSRSGAEGE